MPRLFLTPREINFFSDIAKELTKDIVGQKIFYYPISEVKTDVDELYNESARKVFDNPIILDALVASPEGDASISNFSVDETWKIEVWLQYRDLVEKNVNCSMGDMFSFGDVMYEIVTVGYPRNIYGLPEHKVSVKIEGVNARESLFKETPHGPTDIQYTDPGSIQKSFEQQAGFERNSEGVTNDHRALIDAGLIESTEGTPYGYPTDKPDDWDTSDIDSAFYGDEEE